ncbi:MAG TPA: PLP-dependent aminotransferase family protein [Gemmatimonadales bacterium]|nr:PLP-dependent aminotransferase family protein [Gemmatimonadales bacterium]
MSLSLPSLTPPLVEVSELLLSLDPATAEPLHQQLYRGIREAILSGRLPAGVRIPSTRRLAQDLGISRSTVLFAFDQLAAEGYLVGAVGSGSYIARSIPDGLLPTRPAEPTGARRAVPAPRLAARTYELHRFLRIPSGLYPRAFQTGVPPIDQFPWSVWSRLEARRNRHLPRRQLYHGSAGGHPPLREAIAMHLAAARGVRCTADQVLIFSSAQEALDLVCRALLDPGDAVWFEDPGYAGSRGALVSAGARVIPVPVDRDGLNVEWAIATEPTARLALVSPSHQYPTGFTLSLARRLALLQWAERTGGWIVEDDYDSEYRYAGRPLTALQGLDAAERVLYIGSFNKTLFPSLRLGYLVAPESLLKWLLPIRRIGGQHAPTLPQLSLTDFMVEGHYARHLRRMRMVCRERRDTLLAAASRLIPGLLEFEPADAGLHVVGWLPPGLDDTQVCAAAFAQRVEAAALSNYYIGPPGRGGLLLGYGGVEPGDIEEGVGRLAAAFRTLGLPR